MYTTSRSRARTTWRPPVKLWSTSMRRCVRQRPDPGRLCPPVNPTTRQPHNPTNPTNNPTSQLVCPGGALPRGVRTRNPEATFSSS